MKNRVPCSPVFSLVFLMLAAEGFAFLPSARAQGAQGGAAVSAQPQAVAGTQRLRGQVPAVLARLQPIDRLAATDRLKLAIGLPLRNPGALAQFLQELSDPAHPNYRHYLTPEAFAARFGPTEQDYAAVIAFAQARGLAVTARHPNRTLLDVDGSVADIEKALHLTLRVYQHPTEARTFYAPEVEPSLDLAVPVLGISGLDNYSLPRPRLQATPLDQQPHATPNAGSGPSGTYMGIDFRAAYVPGSPLTGAGQTVGLLQFDGYTASDITYYENQAGLPSVPLVNVLVDGASGQPSGSGGEVEVSLDIEMAISMAPGLAQVIVYMAPNPSPFVDLLNRMATDNLAKQLSCSWYVPGGGPDAVADQIFQQMAAQGQSFFNASGDYDAFTGPVDFPGETPYIVQVGGTMLTTSAPGGAWVSEKVWNRNNGIGGGGGISTRYAIPSYQANISMTLNQGSTTMRNIPDVALTAENVYVRVDGEDYNVGGTSCAAPLWAGFAALVNQQAVASGRPVVGFINPAVDVIGTGSSYTSCFHDITTGDNTSGSSPTRFYAVAGYDLCTGWGTPAGQTLINALATPDALLISPTALAFSGVVGGPFSPNPGSLTLTNSGTNALSWTLVNTSAWFNVSPASGTLLPGGAAASVTVSVAAPAGALSPGVYAAVVAFTNQTSGVAQSCSLALSVAGLSMADDFDPNIDLSQWSGFGGVVGSTMLATNYGGSVSAPNSLWFGNAGSRYATTIPIKTSGGGQIGFCIRLANGSAWPWAQVDNLPAEGVVLESSTNGGGSWTAIGNYDTAAYYNWTGVALPIPAVAQAAAALFRWRQLSNDGTNYDHWALDNVVIGTGAMAPRIVMDPQSQNAAAGDPASLSVTAMGTTPLSYQWLLNGTKINGATSSSLVWTNIQLTDGGTYSVLLSNTVGMVTSSNAILTVYVSVCTPPPSGLVSWWAAEGDASDVLGANNGALQGGASFAKGRVGQAFNFNPASGTVIVPDSSSLRLTNQLTIEAWINTQGTSTDYGIVSKVGGTGGNNGYQFVLSGNTLIGQFNSPGQSWPSAKITSGGIIATGVWYHVAWTYDQSAMKLYCNGLPVATNIIGAQAIAASSSNLRISGDENDHIYFDGLIDESSVYSRALTAAEIAAIYNAGNAGKCRTPVPPLIVTQPQSQTVAVGSSTVLNVTAAGTAPLSYQWQFNGIGLAGASNSALTLTNVQMTNGGSYTVNVTNAYGSATSSNAVLTVIPVLPCTAPPAGLVSWWRGEGNAYDGAGGNSGTLQGGATFAVGMVGQAFNFNPASGTVIVPDASSLRLTNQLTIEAWINTRGTSTDYGIVSKVGGTGGDNGYQFVLSGNTLVGQFNSPGQGWPSARIASGAVITTGVWYHVAWTYDQSAMKLYCNGALVATSAIGAHAIIASSSNLRISGDDNSHIYFDGLIDEVSVYNRALSAAEIAAIYNAGSAGKCWTPVPPAILTQPQSQTVAVGANVGLAVVAAGSSPLSYQWRLNATNIPAASGSALALANVQVANAGTYDVVVTNLYGATNSAAATLTVLNPPQITIQPQDQSVAVGLNATFSVIATGSSPLTYQWYFNGTPLSTATKSTLVLNGVSLSQAGAYTVAVSNRVGSATSRNAILVVRGGGSCTPPATDLVSWWRGEGNAYDGAGGNSGTLQGGATFAVGMVGQAFNFNPASGTVIVPDASSLRLTNQLTIEAWINTQGTSTDYGIVSKVGGSGGDNGYQFVLSGNTLVGQFNSPGQGWPSARIASGAVITTGVWYHVAWTYDQSAMRLYCNGLPVATNIIGAQAIAASSSNLRISGDDNNHIYFDGLIDEVSVYNRALSAAEIAAIYNAGSAGKCALAPSILMPPQSQTVECSSNATFMVSASGLPPLAYRWCFGSNSIAGATNALLTLTNAGFAQAGSYSVVVTNAYGSATSGPAVLTVVDTTPPTIISCASNRTLSVGANCTASLPDLTGEVVAWDASGPVTVTQNPPPGTQLGLGLTNVTFTVRDSSSNASVCVSSVTVADTTPPFVLACVLELTLGFDANCQALLPDLTSTNYIIASDNCSSVRVAQSPPALTAIPVGTNTVVLTVSDSASNQTTRAVTVIVPGKPSIALAPADLTVVAGSNASFSVLACGAAPLLYQWQHMSTNLPSATNAVLALANVQDAAAGSYTVLIANVAGNVTTAPAVLTVLDPPAITRQPANQVAMPGCNASFRAFATGTGPLSYQWHKDGVVLDAQTNTSLVLTSVQASDFGSYVLVVTNACGSVTSSNAVLSLDHAPVAGSDTIQRFAAGGVRVNVAVLLANDTDPDGDGLAIIGVSSNSAAGGTVSLRGCWVFYLPPPGAPNTDTFTYTVSDGHCATAVGTVTVQIKDNSMPWPVSFIENPGDGSFRVTCDGVPGWAYMFQYAEDLSKPVWEDVTTATADAYGTCEYIDRPPTNAPTRFYRSIMP